MPQAGSPQEEKGIRYWLMKTEPDCFSIDDLKRKRVAPWDGVRNYQARNFMRDMKVGDRVFFYHSSCAEPGIVGLARVAKEAYPDHTAWDPKSEHPDPKSTPEKPRWFMVDVAFERAFALPVTLAMLKGDRAFSDLMAVQPGVRLSVQPVALSHAKRIIVLGEGKG